MYLDQALEIVRRKILLHDDGDGGVGDDADRREILHRVVGLRLDHRRGHRVAGRDHQRAVAVLRALGDDVAGDGAAGAGLVLDHDALAEHFAERLGDDARGDIGAAAGAEADHHVDRPRDGHSCAIAGAQSAANASAASASLLADDFISLLPDFAIANAGAARRSSVLDCRNARSARHRRGWTGAAGGRRRRHHHARGRRHRQRRQHVAAGRRRRRWRDPSRGGTRTARRMRDAGRLRHRLGQDHARLQATGEARHPCGRAGVEWRQARRGRTAGVLLSHGADARGREHASLDRVPGDLDRRVSLSRRSRGADRGRHGGVGAFRRSARIGAGGVLLLLRRVGAAPHRCVRGIGVGRSDLYTFGSTSRRTTSPFSASDAAG